MTERCESCGFWPLCAASCERRVRDALELEAAIAPDEDQLELEFEIAAHARGKRVRMRRIEMSIMRDMLDGQPMPKKYLPVTWRRRIHLVAARWIGLWPTARIRPRLARWWRDRN